MTSEDLWVPKTSSGAPTRDDVSGGRVDACWAKQVRDWVAPRVGNDAVGLVDTQVSVLIEFSAPTGPKLWPKAQLR